jgi:hypothetical protein
MTDTEEHEVGRWEDLPRAERLAIRRAAQSQLWWSQLGSKVRGTGPLITAILAGFALWQLLGEAMKEWLNK